MKNLMTFIFLLVTSIIKAQTPDTLWSKTYGGSGTEVVGTFPDAVVASAITASGNIYFVSSTQSNDGMVRSNKGSIDCWLVKYNPNGDTIWTKDFGGEDIDLPTDVIALPDGGCMVCGWTYSLTGDFTGHHGTADGEDGFIARFDSSGNILWGKQYGGADFMGVPGHDWLRSIIATGDDKFIAVGQTNSQNYDLPTDLNTFYVGWFLEIDGNGNKLWSRKIVSPLHNEDNANILYDAALMSDKSSVVAIGTVEYWASAAKIWILKIDTTGTVIWQHEYGTSVSDNIAGQVNACSQNGGDIHRTCP